MRKHGWQLPYHPLQVVAMAVFLALGFAFYVFFAPFVGNQLLQYVAMGIYTPLLICAFGLYIWCAAADPADPGVFKSKKYLHIPDNKKQVKQGESKHKGESTSSVRDANAAATGEDANDKSRSGIESAADCNTRTKKKNTSFHQRSCFLATVLSPCAYACNLREEYSDQQRSEDGMFYCSLCEIEVFKYSKHCRVCDKCVDCFDHHCRWINNCVGKRNYRKFFTLMVSALLTLILQWSTGILVLILCFLKRKQFAIDTSSKLGSSFTVVPFAIVVAVCTVLAVIATVPLAQLFFFHILLIKKGISTYDYIIALREQEQEAAGGQQSPQMSTVSSLTGLSSASSFNTFQRAAWCTPPRLFLEDQFEAIPPDNGSVSSLGKRIAAEETTKKKNSARIKISPWTLARLNAEDVSNAAAEARKNSKILRPAERREDSGSSGHGIALRPDDDPQRGSKRIRLPTEMPLDPLQKNAGADGKTSVDHHHMMAQTSSSLAPLRQLDAPPSAFRTSRTIPFSADVVSSSPESSLGSPDINPLRASSSGAEAARKEISLSRSSSDGYDASGGEDTEQVPARILPRSTNWINSLLYGPEQEGIVPTSASTSKHRRL